MMTPRGMVHASPSAAMLMQQQLMLAAQYGQTNMYLNEADEDPEEEEEDRR